MKQDKTKTMPFNITNEYNENGFVIINHFFSLDEIEHIENLITPPHELFLKENTSINICNSNSLTSPKYFKE